MLFVHASLCMAYIALRYYSHAWSEAMQLQVLNRVSNKGKFGENFFKQKASKVRNVILD
jgi:hypothetical protein